MILLDTHADTFPVGLAGTPFEEVYRALRIVAADAWSVDPLVYRAGMAWGFYALQEPAALSSFRDVVVAALISAMAPMVKESQTDAELVEYLRQWREYTPTFPKLQNLYKLFGADVDIEPISDPESQAVLPVEDTRLAFYVRIESVDFSRPLSLAEAYEIAVRATPMGSRPFPYFAIGSEVGVPVAVATPLDVVTRVDNWEPAVEPIPPVPALPTVTTEGDFSSYNWLRVSAAESVSGGGNTSNLTPDGTNYPDYNAGKSYAILVWQQSGGTTSGRVEFSIVNANGKIQAHNNTGGTLTFYQARVAVCSDSTATVVTVYDSSNNAYNAFKFTLSGTDYYYVLDGTQTDWTDDLASIGYSLTPALPTVTFSDDVSSGTISALTLPTAHSGYYTDAKFDSLRYYVKGSLSNVSTQSGVLYGYSASWFRGTISWYDDSLGDLSDVIRVSGEPTETTEMVSQDLIRVFIILERQTYGQAVLDDLDSNRNGQVISYSYQDGLHTLNIIFRNIGAWTDTNAGRLMLRFLDGSTEFTGLDAFDLVSASGVLSKMTSTTRYAMYNEWNGSVTLNARYASCSEQGVTTVTVYNNSNVAYNAFKFTAGGTDYYYVLDGAQTEWTDDLSVIGYHLPATLYTSANKSPISMVYDYWHTLYDDSGNIATHVPNTIQDPTARQYFLGYYLSAYDTMQTSLNSAFSFRVYNGVAQGRMDRSYTGVIGFVFITLTP